MSAGSIIARKAMPCCVAQIYTLDVDRIFGRRDLSVVYWRRLYSVGDPPPRALLLLLLLWLMLVIWTAVVWLLPNQRVLFVARPIYPYEGVRYAPIF